MYQHFSIFHLNWHILNFDHQTRWYQTRTRLDVCWTQERKWKYVNASTFFFAVGADVVNEKLSGSRENKSKMHEARLMK